MRNHLKSLFAKKNFLFRAPSDDFINKVIMNTAIMITLVSFLFMISGCSYYKVTTKINEQPGNLKSQMIQKLYPEKRYPREFYPECNLEKMLIIEHQIYIIDSHGQWFLRNPKIAGDTIFAQAINIPLPPKDNPDDPDYIQSKRINSNIEKDILKRIKLYVDTIHFWKDDTACCPFASINKYDFYKNDGRRDAGLAMALLGGTIVATLFISLAVAISNIEYEGTTTTSCPFIYTYDGVSWQFNGEVFSGAIFRSLERDDYLALPAFNSMPGGKYEVKMANWLKEVQYINLAELLVVEHDSDVNVMVDKYGEIQTVKEPVFPKAAIDSRGNDCLGLVSSADQLTYDFEEEPDTTNYCMNNITLSFSCNTNPDSCKILVKGHNTLWVDHLARQLFEKLGKKYQYWVRFMDRKPAGEQQAWVLSQGLPLQVYLMKGQEWQPVDYFDIVGPVAAREMVLPLDVRDAWAEDRSGPTPCYTLNVRLVTGYNFWELDYAAMDFTDNALVKKVFVQPELATDQDSVDVTVLLNEDDHRYLVQQETGNETVMSFILPADVSPASSIFLHAKGYYHQVIGRNGKSELAFIWTFLKPGRLSEWSYENHIILRDLLVTRE